MRAEGSRDKNIDHLWKNAPCSSNIIEYSGVMQFSSKHVPQTNTFLLLTEMQLIEV